jgi:hypothetical protein
MSVRHDNAGAGRPGPCDATLSEAQDDVRQHVKTFLRELIDLVKESGAASGGIGERAQALLAPHVAAVEADYGQTGLDLMAAEGEEILRELEARLAASRR